MDLGLFQQQSIKMVMTQELKQAIAILQFSQTELLQYINERALENPLIELQDPIYEERSGKQRHDGYNPFDFIGGEERGLREDLLQQARYLKLEERKYKQLTYLIFQVDDDGYLPENVLADAVETLDLNETEAGNLLDLLQKLDPPGVGARNLRECLLLQIDRLPKNNELARKIVSSHLVSLAKKQWSELARGLSVTETDVRKAAQWIKNLHPKPGSVYKSKNATYIKPDLTIEKRDGQYAVIMNDNHIPKIRLNDQYNRMMESKLDREARHYINDKRREMNWISKCIEQRKETVFNVAKVIVENQKAFLENGFLGLKPMTLKKVAEQLGIHESTVSRAVRSKNVQTPFGMFEMKAFFTSKLHTSSGGEVSSSSVKWLVKELVEHENVDQPLSDQKITELLEADHGIAVSRRTIAKYREQLHIPASSKRRS